MYHIAKENQKRLWDLLQYIRSWSLCLSRDVFQFFNQSFCPCLEESLGDVSKGFGMVLGDLGGILTRVFTRVLAVCSWVALR